MQIKPLKGYLVLKPLAQKVDVMAPPINDEWTFQVMQSYDDRFPVSSQVIVKELTVKTENYIITHIDNVVGVVE